MKINAHTQAKELYNENSELNDQLWQNIINWKKNYDMKHKKRLAKLKLFIEK